MGRDFFNINPLECRHAEDRSYRHTGFRIVVSEIG